jgi:hypothetical protein
VDGYDHREALFGLPPYGGAIQQNVYYADDDLCDSNLDYSRGGYPTRDNDDSGKMASWKAPFILMVDRGDCTFVKKARNAQKAGASGLIIADNTCLCDAPESCEPDVENEECEAKEPIMADDGSGADISIPSYLMFKQDADPVKKVLMEDTMVRMEMSWALPAPDARVEYELWTTPKDLVSQPLQKDFREVAVALGEHAMFTPHMYIYDGLFAGCQGPEGENQCYTLCTNNGRYCATDPDNDLDKGISGADVVTESLRRICIWQEYGKDGVGLPWWDYVDEFLYRCDGEEFFTNDDCIKDAMKRSSVDFSKVKSCMDTAGGVEGSEPNKILDDELVAREAAGVVILPSFFVNQAALRGALTTGEVFEAICSGYASGSEPAVCKKCNMCDDVPTCVNIGHCPGSGPPNSVSTPVFAAALLSVVFCFSCVGLIQWQRSQRQMRSQVRGILAEYMPIDEYKQVQTVGMTEDEDEDGVELS